MTHPTLYLPCISHAPDLYPVWERADGRHRRPVPSGHAQAGRSRPAAPDARHPGASRAGGEGVWTAPGVALGCNRPAGVAALRTEASLTVVHDGAILNAEALRRGLEADGVGFEARTMPNCCSPAATLGPSAARTYRGARSPWRSMMPGAGCCSCPATGSGQSRCISRSCPTARSPSPRKLKGLLAHPLLRRVPDITAVEDFLAYGYVPDDACLVAGVAKLPAAHG